MEDIERGGHIYTYVDLLWWNIFKIQESVVRGDVQKACERVDLLIRVLPNEMVDECKEMFEDMIKQVRAKCNERCGKYIDKINAKTCMEKCRKSEIKDGLKTVLEYISTELERLGYKSYLRKVPKEYV
ncbi:MAG: hypothetical protein QW267_07125 [Sulfolobales archaeon]